MTKKYAISFRDRVLETYDTMKEAVIANETVFGNLHCSILVLEVPDADELKLSPPEENKHWYMICYDMKYSGSRYVPSWKQHVLQAENDEEAVKRYVELSKSTSEEDETEKEFMKRIEDDFSNLGGREWPDGWIRIENGIRELYEEYCPLNGCDEFVTSIYNEENEKTIDVRQLLK